MCLFSKNGTELHEEDFYHIGDSEIVYVRTQGKFSYRAMLSLYKNIGKLGEGGYGSVYLLEHTISGDKIAVKFMDVSDYMRKANEIEKALKESTSLMALNHSGIIKFETAFLLGHEVFMFTEYMPGGELGKYIKTAQIDEQLAKQIFKRILESVQYCHTKGIIHRDLKMENILLQDSNDPLSLKIIDFGIAGIWSVYGWDTSTAGTLSYTPPEVINETDLKSDPKIDIWSLGVILYIILVKRYPFKGKNSKETWNLILNQEINFQSKDERNLSKKVKHLLSMLLAKDKNLRYSMREIVSHPWIQDIIDFDGKDWDALASLKSNLITKAIEEEISRVDYPKATGMIQIHYHRR